MANFVTPPISMDCNTGTLASPVWTALGAANTEIRWHDTNSAGLATSSANWPYMTRPVATAGVDFAYAFTADTTGLGIINAGSNVPTAFSNSDRHQTRWNWGADGTFASLPIVTAYTDATHAAITRNSPSGSLLSGSTVDTGATARSYLKANLWGTFTVSGTNSPGTAPTNAPVITDGATGSSAPGAGAWMANYQGLMADTDYISFVSIPAPVTAQVVEQILRLFTGPSMIANTYPFVITLKYTFS